MKQDKKLEALADLVLAIETYALEQGRIGVQAAASMEEIMYPTQVDLQKLTPYKRDDVKKLLRQLGQWHLVYPVGMNPKRYRFDEWHCRELMETVNNDDGDEMLSSVLSILSDRRQPS